MLQFINAFLGFEVGMSFFWKVSPSHLQILQGSYTCAVCRFSSEREIVEALWFHHSLLYLARSTFNLTMLDLVTGMVAHALPPGLM